MKWNDVNIALPNDGIEVIIYSKEYEVCIAIYNSGKWFDPYYDDNYGYVELVMLAVTHWMPFPDPPKTTDNLRNEDLDRQLPIDEKIGELLTDENGEYRTINGKKIYQIKEKTQDDIDMNLIINRVRASGLRL